MGLKTMVEALIKHGKTIFALTMSELGPMGYIDTEGRVQHYTTAAPIDEILERYPWIKTTKAADDGPAYREGKFWPPYDRPRFLKVGLPAIQNNPALLKVAQARHAIFLTEVLDPQNVGFYAQLFNSNKNLVGQAVDTYTDVWDQVQEYKDPNPKKDRLAWQEPRKMHRRLLWAQMTGGGHAILITHLKNKYEKNVGGDLVVTGMTAATQPMTPRWADLHLRLYLPDATDEIPWPQPRAAVMAQGLGGVFRAGEIIDNPTFASILARVETDVPGQEGVSPLLAPAEADYRTQRAMDSLGKAIPGVDDTDPVAEGKGR